MPIVLPQMLDANAFYAERDARAVLEYPLLTLPQRRIAIIVPPDASSAGTGIEVALFWAASIIRRMGRSFADVIVVASNEFRESRSRLAGTNGRTVEQVLSEELTSADPFGRVEWRTWVKGIDLADAQAVVWLGTLPLGMHHPQILAINAHGWIGGINELPDTDLSLSALDFDAAPAAIVMAASMAAARLFSEAFLVRQRPRQVVFALDSGAVTTDPAKCGEWLTRGTTLPKSPPWKPETGAEPSLSKLLVVSAGGIGGNLCRILRDSYFRTKSAYVVDPDNYELSNLNRAVGAGIKEIGSSKACIAAGSIRYCADSAEHAQAAYEAWITEEVAAEFRQLGAAVAVGVDQVRTRLFIGSDWPWVLLNGATSGSTFSTGVHFRRGGGCLGCWYGQDDASYLATRTPMACAAGVAPGSMQLRPVAGYPFVSVAAAAQLAATVIRVSHQIEWLPEYAGTVVSMSLQSPEFAQTRRIVPTERCLLLCKSDYVQLPLQRLAETDF